MPVTLDPTPNCDNYSTVSTGVLATPPVLGTDTGIIHHAADLGTGAAGGQTKRPTPASTYPPVRIATIFRILTQRFLNGDS